MGEQETRRAAQRCGRNFDADGDADRPNAEQIGVPAICIGLVGTPRTIRELRRRQRMSAVPGASAGRRATGSPVSASIWNPQFSPGG